MVFLRHSTGSCLLPGNNQLLNLKVFPNDFLGHYQPLIQGACSSWCRSSHYGIALQLLQVLVWSERAGTGATIMLIKMQSAGNINKLLTTMLSGDLWKSVPYPFSRGNEILMETDGQIWISRLVHIRHTQFLGVFKSLFIFYMGLLHIRLFERVGHPKLEFLWRRHLKREILVCAIISRWVWTCGGRNLNVSMMITVSR